MLWQRLRVSNCDGKGMASSPNRQGQKTPSSRKTANVEPWSSAEVGTGNESMQWPSPLLVKASCPRVGPCSLSSTARKTRWRENGQQVRVTLSTRTALLSRAGGLCNRSPGKRLDASQGPLLPCARKEGRRVEIGPRRAPPTRRPLQTVPGAGACEAGQVPTQPPGESPEKRGTG